MSILRQLHAGRMRGPAAMIAVPAATSLISSALASRSAGRQADVLRQALMPSGTEGLANRGALGAAGGLAQAAPGLTSLGTGALGQSAGYYGALLGRGGRQGMLEATAPAAANISQTYAGAARSIQPGDRSGTAALQRAELEKSKAGDISRLTAGVQPQAAAALSSLGTNTTGQGLQAYQGAGNIYGGLSSGLASARLGTAAGLRGILGDQSAANQGIGQSLMGILGKAGKQGGGGKGGGAVGGFNGVPFNPSAIPGMGTPR